MDEQPTAAYYIYKDFKGQSHVVDSLLAVPPKFRDRVREVSMDNLSDRAKEVTEQVAEEAVAQVPPPAEWSQGLWFGVIVVVLIVAPFLLKRLSKMLRLAGMIGGLALMGGVTWWVLGGDLGTLTSYLPFF